MDSSLDFTAALARLRALIDDDPRAALDRALVADPLRVADLAYREIRSHGALVLVNAVVVGTYARVLAPGALEQLSNQSLQAQVLAALSAEVLAPFAPEVLTALERALGCSAVHATRAAELIHDLDSRDRAPFLTFLKSRSHALARLWPAEVPTGTELHEARTPKAATTLLREILASALRG